MRGQTPVPDHSLLDQKLGRFNGKLIISAKRAFFTCKVSVLISLSSLLIPRSCPSSLFVWDTLQRPCSHLLHQKQRPASG